MVGKQETRKIIPKINSKHGGGEAGKRGRGEEENRGTALKFTSTS
jgi:hypothetical protein